MALIDDLLSDVEDETAVDDSIIALLDNLTKLLAGQGTPAATLAQIQAVKDVLDANKAKIVAAVTANTPAAP